MKQIFKEKAEKYKDELMNNDSYQPIREDDFYNDIEALTINFKKHITKEINPEISEIVEAFFMKNNDHQFDLKVIDYIYKFGTELNERSFDNDKYDLMNKQILPIFRIIGTQMFLKERVRRLIMKVPF